MANQSRFCGKPAVAECGQPLRVSCHQFGGHRPDLIERSNRCSEGIERHCLENALRIRLERGFYCETLHVDLRLIDGGQMRGNISDGSRFDTPFGRFAIWPSFITLP
jgi:hypothetical protein